MILLALVTGHCAWESVQHPDYKLYRLSPNAFWRQRFPISEDLCALLNQVFVEKSEERITLQELRKRVVDMRSFYLTKEEVADAPPTVKAVWAAYVERGRIQHEEGIAYKPLGSDLTPHRIPSSSRNLLHHARKVLPFIRAHRVEHVHS